MSGEVDRSASMSSTVCIVRPNTCTFCLNNPIITAFSAPPHIHLLRRCGLSGVFCIYCTQVLPVSSLCMAYRFRAAIIIAIVRGFKDVFPKIATQSGRKLCLSPCLGRPPEDVHGITRSLHHHLPCIYLDPYCIQVGMLES